ncbi:phage baseplate assembly protein V [Novosphingobium rosa]|uniref:phage baseplate assembly protein V n=1 Tax=Novosphingobium rosa TaxID=76978 RepID=UPI000835F1CD|nr:phage baseplate assembly protein V [Novosphingobium rosa]
MPTPEDAPTDPDKLIRFGKIASVDLKAARIVVSLDDDSQTTPIRWIEFSMGKTRTWNPPAQGEDVVLLCPGGEIGAGVALRGLVNDLFGALGDDLTSIIEFLDGARLSYDPEGHLLTVALPDGGALKIVAPGGSTLEGDLHCTGTITADVDVIAAGISGKGHKHPNITRGGALSDPPQ